MRHVPTLHVDEGLQQEEPPALTTAMDAEDMAAASTHAGQEQAADPAQAGAEAAGAASGGPSQPWQAPGAQTAPAGWDAEWPWWMVPPPPPPPPLPAFLFLPPYMWKDAWVCPQY